MFAHRKLGTLTIKILVVVALFGGAYMYFKHTQERIETLNREISEASFANNVSRKTIEQLEENTKKQRKVIERLQEEMKKSEVDNDRLKKLLRNHDLTKLSIKKPGLIEKRINDATKKIFTDISDITTN